MQGKERHFHVNGSNFPPQIDKSETLSGKKEFNDIVHSLILEWGYPRLMDIEIELRDATNAAIK